MTSLIIAISFCFIHIVLYKKFKLVRKDVLLYTVRELFVRKN